MQSVTLIIDKRIELSTKYKKLLENESNNVVITKDLLSSLKFIQDMEPDLIIISDSVDNSLSDFCKKIRALTYNMRPVIIATSKSADWEDRLKVLESGADDFISEPINSSEFIMRVKAHLRREFESNLDNKKLLANKNYTIRALKRTVKNKKDWAAMLISIENFKNYEETYTELASDKLLKTFAAIIMSIIDNEDFLGSFSENEFLLITNPLKAERFGNFLTFAFDSVSSKFYSEEDNKRGFMLMRGDETAGRRSNFVHTTIGIVTNEFINYGDVSQVLNAMIDTHNLAEIYTKSNYLVERPKISAENSVTEKIYNKKVLVMEKDEALKLLLKTFLEIQGFEYIENGEIFDEEQTAPAIVILDAGSAENKEGLEICRKIKENKKFNKTKIIVTSIVHDKELILSSGADLYLPKPYELIKLSKWIDFFIKEFNQ